MTTKPETQTIRVVLDLTVPGDLKLDVEGYDPVAKRTVEEDLQLIVNEHGSVVTKVGHIDMAGLDEARRMIRQWYFNEVRDYAKSIPEDYAAQGDVDDRGDWHEFLTEQLDGAGIIIYTNTAKMVLLASDNEDAYSEEIGEAPPNVSAAAFMALQADVAAIIYGEHPDIQDGRLSTDVDPDDEDEDDED